MAKKEVKTDLWVAGQLGECKIDFTAQGSDIKEINDALSTASKKVLFRKLNGTPFCTLFGTVFAMSA